MNGTLLDPVIKNQSLSPVLQSDTICNSCPLGTFYEVLGKSDIGSDDIYNSAKSIVPRF